MTRVATLPDGRVVNPDGPLGRRMVALAERSQAALELRAAADVRAANDAWLVYEGLVPHDCADYRLPDGDCEVCWLASK